MERYPKSEPEKTESQSFCSRRGGEPQGEAERKKKQYHLIEYDVDLSGISRSGYTHSRQVITFNIYLFHINKSYILF